MKFDGGVLAIHHHIRYQIQFIWLMIDCFIHVEWDSPSLTLTCVVVVIFKLLGRRQHMLLSKAKRGIYGSFSQSICVDHWIFLFSQSMVGDLPQTYRHTTLLSLIGRFCPHSVIIIFCFIMLFIIRLLMIEMIDDGCLMLRGEDLRISPPPQVSQFTYRSLAVSSRCSLIWQLVPS